MGMLVRRAVILLLPIAWSWYRARQKAQRAEERRRAGSADREIGAGPAA